MNLFSFDTSAFINGRRDLLPPDVFPSVWTRVEGLIAVGVVRAVDVVRDEIRVRDDETAAWLREQHGLLVELSHEVQRATREVLRRHPKLVGVGGKRNGADPFVIGLAMALDGAVVTEERRTNSPTKPHIPDVCADLGVPCVGLIGFIQQQGWSF